MKTFIKTFIHGIEAFLFDYTLKRKVRIANKLAKQNRYKYMVLNMGGKPVIKQRNIVKKYCLKGVFNCSLETIEKNALYKTY